jgi:hypothetical protein
MGGGIRKNATTCLPGRICELARSAVQESGEELTSKVTRTDFGLCDSINPTEDCHHG